MAVSDKGHGEDLVWGDAHNDPRAWCLFHPLSTPFMLWSVHQQSGGAPSPDYIHIMGEGRGGGGGRGVIGWMFDLRDRGCDTEVHVQLRLFHLPRCANQ